jgi:hypothetical protein
MQDDYKRGYAHGCKAALEVYEALLDELKRHIATIESEMAVRVAELEAQMDVYVAQTERRLAEAAERYGVDFERSPAPRQH